MNAEQMKEMIAAKQLPALEGAWMEAMEEKLPIGQMCSVLEALVAGGAADEAQTLATLLLEERSAQLDAAGSLEMAKALLLAIPNSQELRKQVAALYTKVHGSHAHYPELTRSAGLLGTQSARRAMQTLDLCLSIQSGDYLANRFDHKILRLTGYDTVMGEFKTTDAAGRTVSLDPKNLADEFERVDANDFRVLCQHRTGELGQLLQGDPGAVLIGICLTHGGTINATALKDALVPKYIAADQWSDWWSKARGAAKRHKNLVLTGRSPVVVEYHPAGQTLEQEMAPAMTSAKTPLERLAVLQQYLRELRHRKLTLQPAFVEGPINSLAEKAHSYRDNRPADAIAASLALRTLTEAGVPAPHKPYPSADEIMAATQRPVQVAAELAETDLWPATLEALMTRPDAADILEQLLATVGWNQLDDVAGRLLVCGRSEPLARLTASAVNNPIDNVPVVMWLWRGPKVDVPGLPTRVDLLTRMLKAMQGLDHDWQTPPAKRRNFYQGVRSAIAAADFASYRKAIAEMDEPVADTIKRLIERVGDALAQTVHETMRDLLRESFFKLWQKARVEPWLDENVIWTTQAALDRREAELKDLVEIKIPENARAIGAAAEHGDLSENSEWKFALEERDLLAARSKKLREELTKAQILHPDLVPTEYVGIGSKVRLRRTSDNQTIELSFLGPWDSDVDHNVYSYQTGLGQQLMGQDKGQTVTVKIGAEETQYVIEEITSAV